MNTTPSVNTFDETAALYAVMQGDVEEARRICTAMSRTERTEFAQKMLTLRETLDDLNATRCIHCKGRIARTVQRGTAYWWHFHNHASACNEGGTLAEPAKED